MKLSVALLIGLVAFGSPAALDAQAKGKSKEIPSGSRPPAGMCRIWLDDVPAAQQPAPTDCASAVRNRPAKGRVIFGDDYVGTKRGDSTVTKGKQAPAIKGFSPGKAGDKKPPFDPRKRP